jgi:hypothetical protein
MTTTLNDRLKNPISNERGAVFDYILVILIILSFAVGYKFAVPYYKKSSLENECKEVARLGIKKDALMITLMEKVESLGLPLEPEDFNVSVGEKNTIIQVSWNETIDVFGLYKKDVEFNIDVKF